MEKTHDLFFKKVASGHFFQLFHMEFLHNILLKISQ